MPAKRKKKFEINCTVGRIEDGSAVLLSSEHNILDVSYQSNNTVS